MNAFREKKFCYCNAKIMKIFLAGDCLREKKHHKNMLHAIA